MNADRAVSRKPFGTKAALNSILLGHGAVVEVAARGDRHRGREAGGQDVVRPGGQRLDPAQAGEVAGHIRQDFGAPRLAAAPQDQALGVAVLGRDWRGLVEQDDVVPGVVDGGGVDVAGVGQEENSGELLVVKTPPLHMTLIKSAPALLKIGRAHV